jgi:hypothetical protein
MSYPHLPEKLTTFFQRTNSLSSHPPRNNQLTSLQFGAHTAALALSHAANPQNHTTSSSTLRIWLREHDPGHEDNPLEAVEQLVTQIHQAVPESINQTTPEEKDKLGVEGGHILKEVEDLRTAVRHRLITQAASHDETSTPPYRVRSPFHNTNYNIPRLPERESGVK